MHARDFSSASALLTVAQMARADAAAIAAGVSGERLMENAGRAVADAIRTRWSRRPAVVLCGPGNNGGDGFVVARLLQASGWPVRLALLGARDGLTGDAAIHAAKWTGPVEALTPAALDGAEIAVDAIFGAGLSRPLEGDAKATVEAIGDRICVAVDVPSGVHGDSGAVLGAAPQAALTVTFFRRKPGHLLLPGRERCGRIVVADIGIPPAVLDGIAPQQAENRPENWLSDLPMAGGTHHKYSRGYAVVVGGPEMTGAARLASRAARRVGAGMVSVAVPYDARVIYRVALEGVVVRPFRDTATFTEIAQDERVGACLVGPGNGVMGGTRERALAALRLGKPVVLDADALTVFEMARDLLCGTIHGPCILTPHEGEFRRLFDAPGDKLARVRAAAAESGAVVLLKGADTAIAAPDGRTVVNANAPATLATAGTGDVLAGLAVGLLAQ
ncbi:MAG: NAD(P)H-hydrate dehydratase, partial [Alphaproteobacteria bacterium]